MAIWKVQQKIEMWKETEIEADTYEEAIEKSWDGGRDWEILTLDWVDTEEFWLENQETAESLSVSPDGVFNTN